MRLGSLTIELVWIIADAHWSASRHGDYKEVSGRERRPGKGACRRKVSGQVRVTLWADGKMGDKTIPETLPKWNN